MSETRYAQYGVAYNVDISLVKPDGIDFEVAAVYAAGDVKIRKDNGAEANTTNGFVDAGSSYYLALTAAEMTATRIMLSFIDQGTKAWLDDDILIVTPGPTGTGTSVITPPTNPLLCTVAIFPNVNAVTNGVSFIAATNQAASGGTVAVDIAEVVATVVSGTPNYYAADLVRGAAYTVKTSRFAFGDVTFTVPDAGSVNLVTLLESVRRF